jgi:ABC-2 type transport system permease protein
LRDRQVLLRDRKVLWHYRKVLLRDRKVLLRDEKPLARRRERLARDVVVATFLAAIWGAYLIRTMLLFLLGMITLWTTRVAAMFEIFFTAELLLSGRLVPMDLMPAWVIAIADVLPFESTFGFPIEALVADLSGAELLRGLGGQLLWIVLLWGVVAVVWRRAVRRYSAVGN